jgi:pimeloyl-ACP methyl ester carboxylesterase
MVRKLKIAVASVVAIIFVLILTGIIFERIGERKDRANFPQTGRSFDVGGRSLNIYCLGQGSPTVLFEGNAGVPGYRWLPLQKRISSFTRACWYDRAGLGWSDPGPFPNHSDSIAHDLHDLLGAAGIQPPYVLVGHAMGGFHVRVFRSYYPSEVAGLVLVDPMNEDLTIQIHNHNELLRPRVITILRLVTATGLFRLMQPNPGPPSQDWTKQDWAVVNSLMREPKARIAAAQELPVWANGELARAGNCLGDVRLSVLTAGIQDQEEDPKLDHNHELKVQLHDRLAHLSSRGTHIIVNSGHNIPDMAPDAVVQAVNLIVVDVRKQP